MSTPSTGAVQRRRLRALGLRVIELPALRDVDRFDDALAVAAEAPNSRFARAMAVLGTGEVVAAGTGHAPQPGGRSMDDEALRRREGMVCR